MHPRVKAALRDFGKGMVLTVLFVVVLTALFVVLFMLVPPSLHSLAMLSWNEKKDDEYQVWSNLVDSGTVAYVAHEYEVAEQFFFDAYQVAKNSRFERDFKTLRPAGRLGDTYTNLGKFDLARNYLEESLELATDMYGASSKDVAEVLVHLPEVYHALGEHDLELSAAKREVLIREALIGKYPALPSYNDALCLAESRLARAFEERGEFRAAFDLVLRGVEFRRGQFHDAQGGLGSILERCGLLARKMGNDSDAARFFKEALPHLEATELMSEKELADTRRAIEILERKD